MFLKWWENERKKTQGGWEEVTFEEQPRWGPLNLPSVAQTSEGEASPPESVVNAFPQDARSGSWVQL